ncbi:MAG: oxepin-CoA hydrolase / 3-oxo-5,6-dehydrosuberyl-CoA semialdehyde dehydrogenase [Frankiales bacterium]|nr:oxepin-CoA hydrolase / 3-oxo-5,6-dehydrosuberyl-CoA semialdehyde dehydrogenase [Frankiales bacterium]
MVNNLESYVQGRWQAGTGEGAVVRDAATGEPVVAVTSEGIDVSATLGYGRSVGAQALAALTFHERALALKQLAQALNEQREEFYALSTRTGATKYDSSFDIDGGIGVLFSYAGKGRRELPNDTVYVDGAVEPAGKKGTFVGQHIYTPLPGVAVQVNAFNFPVWGMLEKFAPAFIAGMPTVVKPATQTAYLTALVVRRIIESGLLPEGSLQLLCGTPKGLFDSLGVGDLVAFTGSADTARRLRTHPTVVGESVRFTAEADSLNCSILGLDAGPGTEEFDLYVKQLVTEMTVKAGQKCTAIRRALVPEQWMSDVVDATAAQLDAVTVGNPADESVRMGALVSLEQREEVLRSLKALTGVGRLVVGDPDNFEVVDADKERGAFLPPMLVRCDDADRAEPHEVEAFGPVATVLPYATVDRVIALAARGKGSLVGSVVSHEPGFVRSVVLGLAPWHGRLLVLDRDDARESTGHGSPLPTLVHGGPGRAGGGEELGGIRGVLHHMQRTAVQGSPRMVGAVTGRWVTGQERSTGEHPFRKHLEDLHVGDAVVTAPRTVTLDDVTQFANFTGDTFYAHTDEDAAAANPFFGGLVAHGYLVLSFAAGLFVDPAPGPVLANYGLDNLRFVTPLKPGDSMAVTLTAKHITPRATEPYGEVRWDVVIVNQREEIVATYELLTLVAKREEQPPTV